MKPYMQVKYYTGWFDLENPKPVTVDHRDVALGLSRQARYNGFTNGFYSVAEHCVLIGAWLLEEHKNPKIAMMGLIHDAAEAYIGDLISPVKHLMPLYQVWETRIQEACEKALIPDRSLWVAPTTIKTLIHEADVRIKIDETNQLMSGGAIDQWARQNAQEQKIPHEPLGVIIEPLDCGLAEQRWLNAYNMYRSELEHGVPSQGRFTG